MLHLFADSTPQPRPTAYAEAVSRLASIRHALRLVDGCGGGPAGDPAEDEEIACAWDDAGEGRQRCFERRSARLIGTTAAGLEALLAEQQAGRAPHEAASQELADQIRRELQEVAGIILR